MEQKIVDDFCCCWNLSFYSKAVKADLCFCLRIFTSKTSISEYLTGLMCCFRAKALFTPLENDMKIEIKKIFTLRNPGTTTKLTSALWVHSNHFI